MTCNAPLGHNARRVLLLLQSRKPNPPTTVEYISSCVGISVEEVKATIRSLVFQNRVRVSGAGRARRYTVLLPVPLSETQPAISYSEDGVRVTRYPPRYADGATDAWFEDIA